MLTVRDGLDQLDRDALMELAAKRGVKGARSNDDRRTTLSRSYRGDVQAFLGDLSRSALIHVLAGPWQHGDTPYRAGDIFHRPTAELRRIALELFLGEIMPAEFVPREPNHFWNPFLDFTWEEPDGASEGAPQQQPEASEEPAEPTRPSWLDDEDGARVSSPPTAIELALPSWLMRLDVPTTSRDPLGLQAIAGANADAILPGLNVFTSRARYYSFLTWSIQQAQLADDPDQHLARAQRLERLLVLTEALRHRESPEACSYIGRRRGKAYVREQTDGRGWLLPSKILKNQTSNGALRLYRTSLADLGFIEEDDLGDGLGLRLTDRGAQLASKFGERLDPRVVRWALDDDEQRKRTDTLESFADAMCLSAPKYSGHERRYLFDALFGKSVEQATGSAAIRRETVRLLFDLGQLPDLSERADLAAEDEDATNHDGGAGAAEAETTGNWSVIRALLLQPIRADLVVLQRAAAYELFALGLNKIIGALVDAVAEAGRLSIERWVEIVATRGGPGFTSALAVGWAIRPALDVASLALDGATAWADSACLGLELLVATLGDRALHELVQDAVAQDETLASIVEMRSAFAISPARKVLEELVPLLVTRHRAQSARKGKGEWIVLEGNDLVRGEPRPTRAWLHSLRFVQVQQIAADLGLRPEEVADEA